MNFSSALLQFFLPRQCPCCETFLEEDRRGFCSNCLSEILWIDSPVCSICGVPFASTAEKNHPCSVCLSHKKYFISARALGVYQGTLQEAIHRWKYEGKTHLTPLFGEWLAERLRHYWNPDTFDLLVPVPLHARRLQERGFNQALLLAKELSRRTGIPYRKMLLQKKKSTLPQVHLNRSERQRALRDIFQVIEKNRLSGKSVLLIDDVYTTGTTVNECARALRRGGAEKVSVLTLAHAVRTS